MLPALLLCATANRLHAQDAAADSSAPNSSFQAYAQSAAAARDAGRFDEALHDYQAALQLDAKWQEGWWNLGTLLYDRDRYSEAIPAYRTLAELAPQASPAWIFLGLCEFETKDYANALEHLSKGETLGGVDDPETARVAKYHLALLLIRVGEFERANALLHGLAGAGTNSPSITFALGLALLRVPLLPSQVDPSQEALVQNAGAIAGLMLANDTALASEALRAAVAKYPYVPYLRLAFGELLARDGEEEEALAVFQREADISPQSALPQSAMAYAQLKLGRKREARLSAQRAVLLEPNSRAAHEALAACLAAMGARKEAGEELMTAQKLNAQAPIEQRIVQQYGIASAWLATSTNVAIVGGDAPFAAAMRDFSAKQYPEAIAALKPWLEHNASSGTGWAVLGLSEFALHDYDNALIHLQRGEQLGMSGSPESVGLAKCRLGILLNRGGQFSAAEQALISATVAQPPLAGEITFALGMALLHRSEFPEEVPGAQRELVEAAGEIATLLHESKYDLAFSRLDELRQKYPDAPFLHYTYGTALAALSQYDEAIGQFRAEMALSPSSELPDLGLAALELKRHRAADALESALQAVQLAPRNPTAHYLLGRSYLETGSTREAIAELQKASALTPGSPEVHFNLAKAYAKAAQPDKAAEERAIFAQLNAVAEERRGQQGTQSYGAHDAEDTGISSVGVPGDRPQ
jgi:tetratricopeptide (TPR) repeat protein